MNPTLMENLQSNLRRAEQAVKDLQDMIDLMRDAKMDVTEQEKVLNERRRQVSNWKHALEKRGYPV